MRSIYVLVAEGRMLAFEGTNTIVCRKAFTTNESAWNEMPSFIERCKEDRGGLKELDPNTVIGKILELQLSED